MSNNNQAPLKVARLVRGAATIAVCAIGLSASAEQRPITDFVENQGTYGIIFWIDAAQNTFLVDYAGVVNEAWGMGIPTTFDGSIDEKPLADGTAAVSVILHTHNAYALVQGQISTPCCSATFHWMSSLAQFPP